jgi:hypothetical protein
VPNLCSKPAARWAWNPRAQLMLVCEVAVLRLFDLVFSLVDQL